MKFEVLAQDGQARRGRLTTAHGTLETPGFFAVATQAALKGLGPSEAAATGVQALIANAYHLHLEPGADAVERAGGLHRYMGWEGVLATDSGGFQVFSFRHGHVSDEVKGRRKLPRSEEEAVAAVKVDEDGAEFRSYLDGSPHRFTPESSMALQQQLGADLVMCLDECTPLHVPREYTERATDRNIRWARRCLEAFAGGEQSLYGINHGGIYPDLRERSARAIAELSFDGMAIGDCLGQAKSDWYGVVDQVVPLLPAGRPRHLLGVGEPDDLVEGALRGIDTFDCAMPTRIARHGHALHLSQPRFRLDLTQADRVGEDEPIDESCDCRTCARHTRAYLRHLFRAHELLAVSLTVEHNLRVTVRLLENVREAISAGRLAEYRADLLDKVGGIGVG